MARLGGLLALFAAGLLLAGGLAASGVADVTTTETIPLTTTISETATTPTTIVATVEQTTTQRVIVPAPATTTTSSSSASTTPTWVWVVLGILAAAVIGLIVALLTRRGGSVSPDERQRRLDTAIANWGEQGWAIENQSEGSAVLRHGSELMVVSVDDKGRVTTRPLARS